MIYLEETLLDTEIFANDLSKGFFFLKPSGI